MTPIITWNLRCNHCPIKPPQKPLSRRVSGSCTCLLSCFLWTEITTCPPYPFTFWLTLPERGPCVSIPHLLNKLYHLFKLCWYLYLKCFYEVRGKNLENKYLTENLDHNSVNECGITGTQCMICSKQCVNIRCFITIELIFSCHLLQTRKTTDYWPLC